MTVFERKVPQKYFLKVAIIYGSVVEAIGLLSCKIAEHFIDETLIDEKYVTIVLSAISGLITILGMFLDSE